MLAPMPAKAIFSEPHKAFMRELYLQMMVQPSMVTTMLNDKFATQFKHTQVQRWINANLSERRKITVAIGEKMEQKTNVQIARKVADRHKATMERFVEKSGQAADKAFQFVDNARDARTLASAASAAATMIKTYRLCAGLDASEGAKAPVTFNLNFAQEEPRRASSDTVEVDTTPAEVV